MIAGTMKRLACLLLFPVAAMAEEAPLQQLGAFVEKGLADWSTPGLVLAVVKDDAVAFETGYGVREVGKPERIDAHSRVGIGSTSKAFGAAAIASLVAKGRLGWDDRVTDFLPDFQLHDPSVTHDVRVRDILSHRVGLDLTDENRLLAVATDTHDFIRRLRYVEPAQPFRSNYVYSNAMFTTVGEVVGAVSGKRWDAYLKEAIWEPLGMRETGASLDEALASANHATAHALVGKGLRALPHWEPERSVFEITGPSGAVISTAHDMAQWLRLQLGDGRIGDRQLIDAAIFHEMHTAHTPMRDVKGATSWFRHVPAAALKISDQSYAMGWRVSRYRGRPMIWHGGTVSGFRTVVAFMPQEKLAVFVNGNRESRFPFAVALTVFDSYLGIHDTDWSQLFLTERREQEKEAAAVEERLQRDRIRGTKPALPLERYAGRYSDGAGFGEVEVSRADKGLALRLGSRRGVLEHWHHEIFRVHWDELVPDETFVRFEIDPAGAPAALMIDDIGRFKSIGPERPGHEH